MQGQTQRIPVQFPTPNSYSNVLQGFTSQCPFPPCELSLNGRSEHVSNPRRRLNSKRRRTEDGSSVDVVHIQQEEPVSQA